MVRTDRPMRDEGFIGVVVPRIDGGGSVGVITENVIKVISREVPALAGGRRNGGQSGVIGDGGRLRPMLGQDLRTVGGIESHRVGVCAPNGFKGHVLGSGGSLDHKGKGRLVRCSRNPPTEEGITRAGEPEIDEKGVVIAAGRWRRGNIVSEKRGAIIGYGIGDGVPHGAEFYGNVPRKARIVCLAVERPRSVAVVGKIDDPVVGVPEVAVGSHDLPTAEGIALARRIGDDRVPVVNVRPIGRGRTAPTVQNVRTVFIFHGVGAGGVVAVNMVVFGYVTDRRQNRIIGSLRRGSGVKHIAAIGRVRIPNAFRQSGNRRCVFRGSRNRAELVKIVVSVEIPVMPRDRKRFRFPMRDQHNVARDLAGSEDFSRFARSEKRACRAVDRINRPILEGVRLEFFRSD